MPRLEKATITNKVTHDSIPVMFNPEEYSLSKDINWAQASVPGLSAPILQFVAGNLATLEMELMLDTSEDHGEAGTHAGDDVRTLTSRVTDLMTIDPTTHAPPVLIFTWGSLTFTCVLARATQRFVMFRGDGIPIRARLTVTFNEYRNIDLEAKEIKRETTDYSHVHEVVQGDTLATIAARVYDDPTLWRPIALRNGIDDPRVLTAATRLAVPPLPYRDPETGTVFGA
jgi:hypothetical protein